MKKTVLTETQLRSLVKKIIESLDKKDDVISNDLEETFGSSEKEESKEVVEEKKKIEETIRSSVRKIISEIYDEEEEDDEFDLSKYKKSQEKVEEPVKRGRGRPRKETGEEKTATSKDVISKRVEADTGYVAHNLGHMVGELSLADIAKELGLANPSSAKRVIDMAVEKMAFVAKIPPEERNILILKAVGEYIDFLKESGELTDEDEDLLLQHPEIIATLDGFKEFLDKYIKTHAPNISQDYKPDFYQDDAPEFHAPKRDNKF